MASVGGRAGLPADLTGFVGRRAELSGARELLRENRVVTLRGIGGVGKTRLALRAGHLVSSSFGDGVYFIELAALRETSLVSDAFASALGINDSSSRSRTELIIEYLGDKNALLILDSCEHLVATLAELLERLLRSAPRVRVLIASRQQLDISGEALLEVPPLPLPVDGATVAPDEVQAHPAVDLLVRRAAASVPGFSATTDNIEDLVSICKRLEGIPLAIELAAVRLKVLTAHQLRDLLSQRLPVLSEGLVLGPSRQRTLRETIDWTYELCAPAERSMWLHMSVFADGFSLDAAQIVRSIAGQTNDSMWTLRTLTGLVDKSVVSRSEEAGVVRFRMLETIREYGLERLRSSGESEEAHNGMVHHLLDVVEKFVNGWFSQQSEEWFTILRAESGNLRTVIEGCLNDPDRAEEARQVIADLWPFWIASALPEGRMWSERAAAESIDTRGWRQVQVIHGFIAALQGDQDLASKVLTLARSSAHEHSDDLTEAYATHMLGLNAFLTGELAHALHLLHEASDVYSRLRVHPGWMVSLHIHTGLVLTFSDEPEEAASHFHMAHSQCAAVGDSWLIRYAFFGLAFVAHSRNQLEEARDFLHECLRGHQHGDWLVLALALDLSSWVLAAAGEHHLSASAMGGASYAWTTFGKVLYGSARWMERRRLCESDLRTHLGSRELDRLLRDGHQRAEAGTIAQTVVATDAPGTDRTGPRATPVLTKREHEIACMVADGMSNRDIARQVSLSQRTVEG